MRKSQTSRATIHMDQKLMAEVEALAASERRTLSQMLRHLVADALAGRKAAGSGQEAA
jgi:Arc/MetJ family transcription regulator